MIRSTTKTDMKKSLTTFVSIAILLIIWQITAMCVNQPEFFPSLSKLLGTLAGLFTTGSFYLSVGATVLRGITGMCLSFVCALFFAGLFARWEWIYELFRPLLSLMRSVPVISFILIALIFLHPEGIPVLIGFLTMFPLLTENLTQGIRNLNPDLSFMSRQFRFSRRNRFTQVIYPQLKPFLFSGLTSAAGFGWRAIIMGEVLTQCSFGIGSEMKKAQTFIAVPELLAWTMIAIVISFLSDKAIQWLAGRKIVPSYQTASNASGQLPDSTGKTIEIKDISYHYGISHFSKTFESGRVYGISAPSGTGKTTLLNLINGRLRPISGTLLADRSKGLASLFQEPLLLSHLTALDNVALVLAPFYTAEKATTEAAEILSHLDLETFTSKYPHELSYGQQQRVAIARALAYPSPYLLMDEPFKGLDEALTTRIINYIRKRQQQKRQTILFASHQAVELTLLAEEVIVL